MYHIIVTLARNKFLSRVIKFHWFLLARAYERTGGEGGWELSLPKRSTTCGSATHSGGLGGGWEGGEERKHGFSRTTYICFFLFFLGGVWEGGRRQKSPQPFLIFFFFTHTHQMIRCCSSIMYVHMYIPTCLCMYIVHMYINYMYKYIHVIYHII